MPRLPRTYLGIYAAVLTVAFAGLLLMGARSHAGDFDTINVHRINVREPDGTLRMVISDKARFPGLIMYGKETPHPRPRAGMLFYNDEGTEQGGLIYSGHKTGNGYSSGLSLTFDRYDNDQQLQLIGLDQNGRYFAGMRVNDVPDGHMEHGQDKPLVQRFYAGKAPSGNSVVLLRDADGRPRLGMQVTPGGKASIMFLDANGKVQRTITADDLAGNAATRPSNATGATGSTH